MVSRGTHTTSKQTLKPYNEGYKDFYRGQIVNPYDDTTKNKRDWESGFNKAYFQNLERVLEREVKERSKEVSSN